MEDLYCSRGGSRRVELQLVCLFARSSDHPKPAAACRAGHHPRQVAASEQRQASEQEPLQSTPGRSNSAAGSDRALHHCRPAWLRCCQGLLRLHGGGAGNWWWVAAFETRGWGPVCDAVDACLLDHWSLQPSDSLAPFLPKLTQAEEQGTEEASRPPLHVVQGACWQQLAGGGWVCGGSRRFPN